MVPDKQTDSHNHEQRQTDRQTDRDTHTHTPRYASRGTCVAQPLMPGNGSTGETGNGKASMSIQGGAARSGLFLGLCAVGGMMYQTIGLTSALPGIYWKQLCLQISGEKFKP